MAVSRPEGTPYEITNRILAEHDVDMFFIDLRQVKLPRQGASLFILFVPENKFLPDVDVILRLRKGLIPSPSSFTHKGGYRLQLSPHEVENAIYFVSLTNILHGWVNYKMIFSLNPAQEVYPNTRFDVFSEQSLGERILYYYFNISQYPTPEIMQIHLEQNPARVELQCTSFLNTSDGSFRCFSRYFEQLVNRYYGTFLPVCKAHEMVRRGIVRDCRPFARFVGFELVSGPHHNPYFAYQSCPPGVCSDGCKNGLFAKWAMANYRPPETFPTLAAAFCRSFGILHNRPCIQGIGSGIQSSGDFSVEESLMECERLARDGAASTIFVPTSTINSSSTDPATSPSATPELIAEWQESCFKGVFRTYMDPLLLADDNKFEDSFALMCRSADVGSDSLFAQRCFEALGEIAALKAWDYGQSPQNYCDLLGNVTYVAWCLVGVREYQTAVINPVMHNVTTCPTDKLHSIVYYNLPAQFSEGNFDHISRQ